MGSAGLESSLKFRGEEGIVRGGEGEGVSEGSRGLPIRFEIFLVWSAPNPGLHSFWRLRKPSRATKKPIRRPHSTQRVPHP